MTKEDRDRAQARADKGQGRRRTRDPARPNATPAAKAVLDNMAKLKALRLAREAAEPQRAPCRESRKEGVRRHQAVEREAGGLVRLAGEPAEWRTENLRLDSYGGLVMPGRTREDALRAFAWRDEK
jgi:hypothetical protein